MCESTPDSGRAFRRLGFFTRLLDDVDANERYRLALEQIRHAERCGFDSAWVAQHHFDADEGGLPAPLVFLAEVATLTSRIRLGTGVITLAMEQPLRVAEDLAVLDLRSGGRLEVGLGTGGSPAAFAAFGLRNEDRHAVYNAKRALLMQALAGELLPGGARLYPSVPSLRRRLWQATFSVPGGVRAGKAGDGLMLSRTQPRPADSPAMPLHDMQNPIIGAYLAALPAGVKPRVMASRSLFVADRHEEAMRLTEIGLKRAAESATRRGIAYPTGTLAEVIKATDTHVGTPEEVIADLLCDTALARATDIVFQVHSADPPHPYILRSIELLGSVVAPTLGWRSAATRTRQSVPAGTGG